MMSRLEFWGHIATLVALAVLSVVLVIVVVSR